MLQALALVLRTAFDTAKGCLVRSILFPKPSQLSFYADSFKFVGGLAVIGAYMFIVFYLIGWFGLL
jgi:cation-transporting ATPase 13A3/4/5